MTARLQLSIGCAQSRKLKNATRVAAINAGAVKHVGGELVETGSISVQAKLWHGSDRVMRLCRTFASIQSGFKQLTLPWGEGIRIFKADRIHSINDSIRQSIDRTDELLDDIANNYESERDAALLALGVEGDEQNYPANGQLFRDGVVRRFYFDTISPSNKLIEMVGGQLGDHIAREHEDRLRGAIVEAQQAAADQLADIIRRFIDVCDPAKKRTRVTNDLFADLQSVTDGLTSGINNILLVPNPQLERLASEVRASLTSYDREALAEDKDARSVVHRQASDLLNVLGSIPIV